MTNFRAGNLTVPTSAVVTLAYDASGQITSAPINVTGCVHVQGDLHINLTSLPSDLSPLALPIIDAQCFHSDTFGKVTVGSPDPCVEADATLMSNSKNRIIYLVTFYPSSEYSKCQVDAALHLEWRSTCILSLFLSCCHIIVWTLFQ